MVSRAAELVCWPLLLEGRDDALFFAALACPSCALAMYDDLSVKYCNSLIQEEKTPSVFFILGVFSVRSNSLMEVVYCELSVRDT